MSQSGGLNTAPLYGVEVSKLTSALVSFQITSRTFTEWFNVLAMQKSGDTSCRHLEGSKMTATDALSQESGNTASGTGISIITSSMKTRLALQRWLINTRFFLSMFCDGSAKNSQKSPPHWGRLEYAIFSTDILTRHVYCPCTEFNVFSQELFNEVSNWLSYHNFDFINLDSTICITTPHKVAKSKLVEEVLDSVGSDI